MKKLLTVTRFELMRYFISPLAYVYLISFLILNGAAAFYFGHFFERGQASLEPMFWYQPWLYLLFISGISMRLWAEEFKSKTVVQIMTMPVSTEILVWGKFFASWIFCALALILTFPFWITVNILGTPDNMVIAISYVGSFILAGCMISIAQTMSALTKNQVIALVLAVIANLVFFWSGIEFVLSFFRLFLPDYLIDTIASFSFITHFETIIQGLVELRDILFFASIILLFNFTTVLIVSFKTAGTSAWLKSTNRAYYVLAWFLLVIGFMGFNLLANNLTRGTQIDFSQDKLFTLNQDTKYVLRNLPESVTAKLYYSPLLEQRNPLIRQTFDKIRLLLGQYKSFSNGRFDYRIYYPKHLDNVEDRAIADNIQPIPLIDINQNALFGLTLSDTLQNKQSIPLLMAENMETLEQTLTSKIYQLTHRKKTVGIISSLPVNGSGGTNSMIFQPWEIYNQLKQFYNIVDFTDPKDFENKPDALLIIHPQNLSDEMVEAIKNYSKNGGNILLLLDSAAEAPRLYSPVNTPFSPSDLKGLDEFWGFKFYNEYAVADLDNSILVDATSNYKNNPAFTQDVIQFKLKPENFNPRHPVTRNLKSVLMSSVSIILPTSENVMFTALLQGSSNSSLMPISVVYDGLNPRQILSFFKPDNNPKVLAAAIQGNQDNPFNLIVVGDTDFIYDSFWASSQMILDQTYFTPMFNNADFILNSLDYLTSNWSLLNLRGKSRINREFTELEKQRKNNVFQFKVKEEEIFERINLTKVQLQEIWGKRAFEERENFTADELAVIGNIRKQLDRLRRELSDVRAATNQSINKVGQIVKFFNIFAVPLLIGLAVLLWLAFQRKKRVNLSRFCFNRQLGKLTLGAFLIFAAGVLSVYFANRSDIQKYEGKLLLPTLKETINDVQKIVIKTHDQTLTLNNQEGEWKLEEHAEFPVYQERIRSFLTSLLDARFYEKKSNKAENLHMFGLDPIEVENSKNTRIELLSSDGSILQTLEVGTYNIDIGRGGRAAYVKFDNQFQVWLAEADFIDLSTNFEEWTYSTLWNLRFGRLASFNDEEDSEKIAKLASLLLNTPFKESLDLLDNKKEIGKLVIKSEFEEPMDITFFEKDKQIFAQYRFPEEISQKDVELFAKYTKDRFLKIDFEKWEKIKDVANFK